MRAGSSETAIPHGSVRLALMWILQAQFAGYALARRELPALELIPWRPGASAIDQLAAGEAEFGVVSPAQLVVAGSKAKELVFVGLFMSKSPIALAGLRSRTGDGLAGLDGVRVGVWEGEDLEVRAMLGVNGVDNAGIEFVAMGADVRPLLVGEVDLLQATTYEEVPALLAAGADPEDLVLHRPQQWNVDVAKDGLVVRRDVIDEHPDLVDSVVASAIRGWQAALDDPEDAVATVCALSPDLDPAWQTQQLGLISRLIDDGRPIGFPDPAEVDRATRVHRLVGNAVEIPEGLVDAGPWERSRSG